MGRRDFGYCPLHIAYWGAIQHQQVVKSCLVSSKSPPPTQPLFLNHTHHSNQAGEGRRDPAVMATLRSSWITNSNFSLSLLLFSLFFISTNPAAAASSLNDAVFSVKYKYAGQEPSLTALKAHDDRRQLRMLAGVDLPLGGSGRPDAVGSLSLSLSIYIYIYVYGYVYIYVCD